MVGFDPLANTGLGLRKKPIVGGQKSDIGKFSPDPQFASVATEQPKASFVAPAKSTAPTPASNSMITKVDVPQAPLTTPQMQSTTVAPTAPVEQPKQATFARPADAQNQAKDSTINLFLSQFANDIKAGMPREVIPQYYSELPVEVLADLYEDVKMGSKIEQLKPLYPELQNLNPLENIPVAMTTDDINPFAYAQKGADYVTAKAEDINIPLIEPIVQGFSSSVSSASKGIKDVTTALNSIEDKTIGEGNLYNRSNAEDAFDLVQGGINTAVAYYTPAMSIAFNSAIQGLPVKQQQQLGEIFSKGGEYITMIPGFKQLKASLPTDRQQELEQELFGAFVGLLLGTKGKANIIKNPMKFIKENGSLKAIMRNVQENVLNIPVRRAGQVIQSGVDQGKNIIKEGKDKIDANAEAKKNAIVMNEMEQSIANSKAKQEGLPLPYPEKKQKSEVGFTDRLAQAQFGVDAGNVKTARENPTIFKQIDQGEITPETVKEELMSLGGEIKGKKGEAGELYKEVYENPAKFDSAEVADTLVNELASKGVKFDETGKITGYDATKSTYSTTEFGAIKDKFNNMITDLKNTPRLLSVEEMHNIRKDIYNTSYSEGVATKKAKGMDILSNTINDKYLKKIPGFSEIDDAFKEASYIAKEVNELVFNRKGEFRGTLKSLLNESQYKRLQKLEEYIPGITKKIETLVAHDDFVKAQETAKVGLYNRGVAGAEGAIIGTMIGGPGFGTFLGSLAGTALSTYISNPKFLKQWVMRNAGKEVATKVSQGKKLSKLEQAKLQVAIKTAKVAEVKAQFEEYKKQTGNTKGMGLPEKTTNNIGTPKNPIKAGYTPAKPTNKGLQAKSKQETATILSSKDFDKKGMTKITAIGYGDQAPKVGDFTSKGKIVETTHSGGGSPQRRVKVEGDTNWTKASDIEIYRKQGLVTKETPKIAQKKGGMVEKTAKVDGKGLETKKVPADEVAPRDMPQEATPIKNRLQEIKNAKGWTPRKETLNSIQSEYGFKIDDLSIEDTDKLAKALNGNTSADKAMEIIEEIGGKYGKKFQKETSKPKEGLSEAEISKTVAKYFKPDEVSVVFREKITTPDGSNAFGAYHNKMIEFAKNPMKGTPEHEVVHAYIDLFKTNQQKLDILDHVLETRKLEVGATKKKYGITDDYLGAEEFLADGFIKYAQGKATFTGKLKTYFQDLWNDIKQVFGKEDKVRRLYQDITGKKRPKSLEPKNTPKKFMQEDKMQDLYTEARKYKSADEFVEAVKDNQIEGQRGRSAPSGYGEKLADRLEYDGDVTLREELSKHIKQPNDFFEPGKSYGFGKEGELTKKAIQEAKKTGKITVYRAVGKGIDSWRDGDWVYFVEDLAKKHGDNAMGGKYDIISKETSIDNVWRDGNDLNERGFDDGSSTKQLRKIREEANKGLPEKKFMKDTSDEVKELVVIHNLTPEKLKKVVDLGGMPAPSIAITQKAIPFENYGDITLVSNKNLIDPKNKDVIVGKTDIYTPTVPTPEYILKKDSYTKQRIKEISKETGVSEWNVKEYFEDRHGNKNWLGNENPQLKKYDSEQLLLTDKKIFKGLNINANRMYKDYTIDNIVKDMFPKGGNATTAWGGGILAGSFNGAMANRTPLLKSIQDIKKVGFTAETPEMDAKYEKLESTYSEKLRNMIGDEKYWDLSKVFTEYIKKSNSYIASELKKYGAENVSEAKIQELKDILDEGLKLPKSYIEAKIKRGVYLNEFQYVLAPEGEIDSIKNILKDTPLKDKVVGYKPSEGRAKKLQELQDKYGNVFFSLGGVLFPFAYLIGQQENDK